MKKEFIILDTDIGDDIDDAFALNLLLSRNEVELVGITTTYKNTEQRARIIKKLLLLSGANIPVYAGEDHPLANKIILRKEEHFEADGSVRIDHYSPEYDNLEFEGRDAPEFILKTIAERDGEITLVGIGPLTNFAIAYLTDKQTFLRAKRLLIMGGCVGTRKMEWNLLVDPLAAKIVLESGIDISIVPLDVTEQVVFDDKAIACVRGAKGACAREICAMMEKWIALNNPDGVLKKYPTMHDPLAVSTLWSDVCRFEKMHLRFPLYGDGKNCTLPDPDGNICAMVATQVDRDKFFQGFLKNFKD